MRLLQEADKKVFEIIRQEEQRQAEVLEMIPSENYTSRAVREAMASVFSDKYSEGYPKKRYYQGNSAVDQIEQLAIDRAKKLFGVIHVNVQPYSGSPANLAILSAVCQPGETILSQHLSMGGHLSMGQEASVTSKYYHAVYYGLTPDGNINWDELKAQAIKHRPKIIFCGGTAFTKLFDFKRYGEIADSVGAYFVADISHIGGLVAGHAHPSPKDYAHIIMTTTHKTLRGPRGAMIMVTEKGLKKDLDLPAKIDKAVFPGLQGGPHNNTIAALAVALNEAATGAFRSYSRQVVKNSRVLAKELSYFDFDLIGDGTENHMVWINLANKGIDGWSAAWACEAAGIVLNRQTIPLDEKPAYYPSGIRLGTPAITTRGMKEREMRKISRWLNEVIERAKKICPKEIGSGDRKNDQRARKKFKKEVFKNPEFLKIKRAIKRFTKDFPVP